MTIKQYKINYDKVMTGGSDDKYTETVKETEELCEEIYNDEEISSYY